MPSGRILVVDDEEMNLDLCSRRLERSGFLVSCARSGRAALEELGRREYDLVLLDQMMPEMSGVEVLKQLRSGRMPVEAEAGAGMPATLRKSDIAIIMVTAVTDSGQIAEALDWGADDYITKPVDYAVALARIRTQLNRRRATSDLRRNEERHLLAARSAADGLWEWDFRSGRAYYSAEWKRMLGLADDEISGLPADWLDRIHPEDRAIFDDALDRHMRGVTRTLECEQRVRAKDGSYHWMLVRAMCQHDAQGAAQRLAGTHSVRPERATLDAVTGLGNQWMFLDQLGRALEGQPGQPALLTTQTACTVLLLGLDRFQQVNDSLGHPAGDQLLREVAGRLQRVVRGAEPVVARLEGDTFAILVETPRSAGSPDAATAAPPPSPSAREVLAGQLAGRILEALRPPVLLDGHEIFSTASIGIVLVAEGDAGIPAPAASDVMRDAETAMHAAKARGRGRWVLFEPGLRELPLHKLQLESELRQGLRKNQFEVYYQPRIRLTDGAVCGFEALVRWNHPERGLVMPGEFIPLAEETGLIVEIGREVLWEACRQTRLWQQQFPREPQLDIAVNLSVCQAREPGIVDQIAHALSETGLAPECLHLELTESLLLDNLAGAREVLMALKAMGVGLKVDDFGTGYSSLSYLNDLPFDSLKIDRCFTMALDESNPASSEMVKTILGMARSLHLGVVAEGVERLEHLSELLRLGCEFGQGFFFSKPVSAGEIERMLRHFQASPDLPAAGGSGSEVPAESASSRRSSDAAPRPGMPDDALAGWDAWNHRGPALLAAAKA